MLGKHPKSRTLLLLLSLTLIIGIAAAVLKEQVRASAHEVVLTVEDEPVTVQKLSGDKNIVPLKVAKIAAFCFIGTSSCPESRTRTCTDCRNGQEDGLIND